MLRMLWFHLLKEEGPDSRHYDRAEKQKEE